MLTNAIKINGVVCATPIDIDIKLHDIHSKSTKRMASGVAYVKCVKTDVADITVKWENISLDEYTVIRNAMMAKDQFEVIWLECISGCSGNSIMYRGDRTVSFHRLQDSPLVDLTLPLVDTCQE